MAKKKQLVEIGKATPLAEFPNVRQIVFDYLKDNLSVDVSVVQGGGTCSLGDNGQVKVAVRVFLRNPRTGENEIVAEYTGYS